MIFACNSNPNRMTMLILHRFDSLLKNSSTLKAPLLLIILIFNTCFIASQTVLNNDTFDSTNSIWSTDHLNTSHIDVSDISNLPGLEGYACNNAFATNVIQLTQNGAITSSTMNLSAFTSVIIEYDYFVDGLDNDERWLLELSSDGGNSWTVLKQYNNGTDFNNGDCGVNSSGLKEVIALNANNFNFNTNCKLRLRIDANDIQDYLFVDNLKISVTTDTQENLWLGHSFNSINNVSLWSLGVIPNESMHIIIPENNELKITSDNIISDITVLGDLIIEKTGSLTVKNNFINTGTVVMSSDAYASSNLIVNGIATGTIHYDKWVNDFEFDLNDMDIIAPPVSGESVAHFLSNNSASILNNGTFYAVNPYNNGGHGWDDSLIITSTSHMLSGNGYAIATPPNNSQTVRFTGHIETESTSVTLHQVQTSWNVVGNPYTSYLNVSDFLQANAASIDNAHLALIAYNNNTDQETYQYYNLASAIVDNVNVAPGQGFYVAAKNDNAIINFTPSMRTTRSSANASQNFTNNSDNNKHKLRLNLTNGNDVRHTQFYFFDSENVTEAFDIGYDTYIFDGNSNFNLYSTLIDNTSDEQLAIQTLPLNYAEESIIPIGIEAQNGYQITVTIDNIDIPLDTTVWLEDRDLEQWIDLTSGASYTLSLTETTSGFGRFYLHFETDALLSASNAHLNTIDIKSIHSTKQLLITGQLTETTQLYIYDVNGRVVSHHTIETFNTTNHIDVSSLNAGIYIIELKNKNQVTSKKVIIS